MSGGVEQEKCPRCEKVVYDAEGFPAGMCDMIVALCYVML